MTGNECSGTQTKGFSAAPSLTPREHLRRRATAVSGSVPIAALWESYWRTRDLELRNQLVLMHQSMVQKITSRFCRASGRSSEDLLQVGYLGLIAAIERYDPGQGTTFATYAVPTIIGCIKHHLRDQTWMIKPPRRLRELAIRLRNLCADLEVAQGRPATPADVAEAAGLELEQVLEAMEVDHVSHFFSLDSSAGDGRWDMDLPIGEQIGSTPEGFAAVELRETVATAVQLLEPRLRDVLRLRFYRDLSQVEAAKRLGISQMHVSRLERQAIRALRTILDE